MHKKNRRWYKVKGCQMLYQGNPQQEMAVAEIFRSGKSIWMRMHCNPKTGKPWKSMTEAREWLEGK
jgi:hypothetical protein